MTRQTIATALLCVSAAGIGFALLAFVIGLFPSSLALLAVIGLVVVSHLFARR
ncbi:hypothetical protein GR158_09005 [Shinella sp. AETb1-6]|jgi:hypothetical protein|uniref:Uncharacterized protein n=1 Tax=Shinella sumterensis TaxID=1967501 RepID=A0AA50D877_9HYPH|nr:MULTISPECIES: hypothetical protein [Shinella]MCD1266841.1 hypothetical protein [Shinella sumterensis]MXN51254.1 hypothetical protein [Shinella sp. AETb1-6]WLR96160.1 hypothetical protein Q9313_10460 [Shinella sumterensis]WLS09344.1 hypothetical protein Q9314_06105 [Shinella sumterensis]